MKKQLLAFAFLLFTHVGLFAQTSAADYIVKRDGELIGGIQIREIQERALKYRYGVNPKLKLIWLKEVAYYQSQGKRYDMNPLKAGVIAEAPRQPVAVAPDTTATIPQRPQRPTVRVPLESMQVERTSFFEQGRTDAQAYYKGYKGAGTGTFLTTFLLSPAGGLITAIAASSTPPKPHTLMYPDAELWKNAAYQSGYINQAGRIKRRKVWKNWGLGFLGAAAVGVATYAAVGGTF